MGKLTDTQADFLREGHIAAVATIRPDGTPQLTPTWVDSDGEHVLINTAEGRKKPEYMRQNPHTAVLVVDRNDPYRWLSVSGTAELTHEGAVEHIDVLAHRYTGGDYDLPSGQERVLVRVKPERVTSQLE